jgi:hypothetical protein
MQSLATVRFADGFESMRASLDAAVHGYKAMSHTIKKNQNSAAT